MKFHRLKKNRQVDICLCEPSANVYVWLSFWIAAGKRDQKLSFKLIEHILQFFPGRHHIHPLKQAKNFYEAAKILRWKHVGRSPIFADCDAFQTNSASVDESFRGVHDIDLSYSEGSAPSTLRTFSTKKDLRQCIQQINIEYGG